MDDDIEVIEWTEDEWVDAIGRRLSKLGLTYDELRAKAEAEPCGCCGFDSLSEKLLWWTIKPGPWTDPEEHNRFIQRIKDKD